MKKTILILAATFGLAAGAFAQAFVILTNDQRIEGSAIRARPDGTIVLVTATGQVEYPPSRVKQAVAPRPPEFDQAVAHLQARRFDEGIKLLRNVVAKSRFLTWDENASKLIGRAQAEKGDLPEAVKAYEEHLRMFPRAEQDSEWLWGYFNALLPAREFDKLEPRLNKLIAEGGRRDAARAQVMRGDIRLENNQVEAAVLDYLRAVMFYESEKDVLPTAIFRAASGLERLRDPRAKDWFQRVAEEFPASPEGVEARKKL